MIGVCTFSCSTAFVPTLEMIVVETVGVRDLANRASAVLDELEQGGQPIIVTRRGHPVAVLAPIDAEAFYDYVLAHAPEFVAGRKAAEERFARGDFGRLLDDVLAELDEGDHGGASA
ncbi:MAG TPA: type II toxin-antitoxin system Phd/YefM family antitoxin [Pseudonocardiaceae bacterium]|nr:type II toxin-antitoxin system Phd/YefM family antitoxin [Pseudonocardiaceae bacterium]